MKRFGKIKYPDNVLDIIKDKKFVSVLFNFAKKEYSEENILFLMSPFEPKTLYVNFLKDPSRHTINIPSPIRDAADILGSQERWDDPGWNAIIRDARAEIETLVDRDTMSRFWKSDIFLDYHAKNGGSKQDTEVTPYMEAAEELGFKNHELLESYIKSYEASGEDATLILGTKLLRSEGKVIRVQDFNKILIGRGYMTAKKSALKPAVDEGLPPPPPRVKLDLKKLKDCGFENVGGVIIQERCQEMIAHYLNKETQKAIIVYEKILKAEPKGSKLQTVPLIDLMKLLKSKRAYEDLAN